MSHYCQSEISKLRTVLMKHPRDAFGSQKKIQAEWQSLGYLAEPDFEKAIEEFDRLVEILVECSIEILWLPSTRGTSLDSIYARDCLLMTGAGAIVCRMGKEARRGEEVAAANFLNSKAIPIHGSVGGNATLESGDVIWLCHGRVLAVGHSYRSDATGLDELRSLTSNLVDEFVEVPMPCWEGPASVLHLMSIISPIDEDLALVYPRLMPVVFEKWLLDHGIKLVRVPDSEFASMGCNVLAISPRKVLMLEGNPKTKHLLEEEGVETIEFSGHEICYKGQGGPTCLIRPLRRED